MKTCLVVDDSSVVRKVATGILTDLGFNCIQAEDGQIALNKSQENMPDLVMLDWNMPVMSGIEYLEKLRALPNGDKPKVVLCTTENELSQIMKALEQGANEYIMKPFDAEIIKQKLSQIGIL